MKVIFLQDVPNVARQGEIKEVSTGYFQNFLSPRRLAVFTEAPEAARIKAELAAKVQRQQADIGAAKQRAAQFEGQKLRITAKAQGQKLFGAIHEAEIAQKLGIDKKLITLKTGPLKTLGEHRVELGFDHGQKATIIVEVVGS